MAACSNAHVGRVSAHTQPEKLIVVEPSGIGSLPNGLMLRITSSTGEVIEETVDSLDEGLRAALRQAGLEV